MKMKTVTVFCPSSRGVDPRQLRMGTRVEMEHTKSRTAARCIALAHLSPEGEGIPDYYTRLAKMERAAKRSRS